MVEYSSNIVPRSLTKFRIAVLFVIKDIFAIIFIHYHSINSHSYAYLSRYRYHRPRPEYVLKRALA